MSDFDSTKKPEGPHQPPFELLAAAAAGYPYPPAPAPMAYGQHMPAQLQGGYQRYREMTIDELLLENRVICLVGEIHHASATGVIMRLLHLQNQKKNVDINLYINSPGGSVDDTLAIYDT